MTSDQTSAEIQVKVRELFGAGLAEGAEERCGDIATRLKSLAQNVLMVFWVWATEESRTKLILVRLAKLGPVIHHKRTLKTR